MNPARYNVALAVELGDPERVDDIVGVEFEVDVFAGRDHQVIRRDDLVVPVFVEVVAELPPPLLALDLDGGSGARFGEIEHHRQCPDGQADQHRRRNECPCELGFTVSVNLRGQVVGVVGGLGPELHDDRGNRRGHEDADAHRHPARQAHEPVDFLGFGADGLRRVETARGTAGDDQSRQRYGRDTPASSEADAHHSCPPSDSLISPASPDPASP